MLEFITRLADVQRKQKLEFEKLQVCGLLCLIAWKTAELVSPLQADSRAMNDEYNRKARQLDSELEGYKLQKSSLRDQIVCRVLPFPVPVY